MEEKDTVRPVGLPRESGSWPLVSVIVPNLNNAARLESCLRALAGQSYPAGRREIIVVDNGSGDDSRETAARMGARVIVETGVRSPYTCRNRGVDAAGGEIVALLDSNCRPSKDWLQGGVAALLEEPRAIVTGPIRFEIGPGSDAAELADACLFPLIDAETIRKRGGLPGGHLLTRRATFAEIGLFPSGVRSGADIEWTGRAREQGYRFVFAEGAAVDYPPKKLGPLLRKAARVGRGFREIRQAKDFRRRWKERLGLIPVFLPVRPGKVRERLKGYGIRPGVGRLARVWGIVWLYRMVVATAAL